MTHASERENARISRREFEAAAMASALERLAPDLKLVERYMGEQFGSASQLVALLGDHVLGSGGARQPHEAGHSQPPRNTAQVPHHPPPVGRRA